MQHSTRNTAEASAWCKRCGRSTMHRVDGVKLGACTVCLEKLNAEADKRREAVPGVVRQMSMFADYTIFPVEPDQVKPLDEGVIWGEKL